MKIVIIPKKNFKEDCLLISQEYGVNKNMKMDIAILDLKENKSHLVYYEEKECAILLIEGEISLKWDENKVTVKRENCFDCLPSVLHIPKNKEVEILSLKNSEILIQATTNSKEFEPRFYGEEDCKVGVINLPIFEETAKREIRDIINYDIAPYSNLVIGEVITFPGKWSSYPSHSHDQPEVYYYKFTKPQGFGACFIGENTFKITDKSAAIIEGGLVHPQVTAPGYGMYYCWMIRHLDNNPWTTRVNEKCHEWLLDENQVVWPNKK